MATKNPGRANATAQPTQTVTALVPIEHDNTAYEVGATFDVGVDCLPQLLSVNAVEVVKAAVPELPEQ